VYWIERQARRIVAVRIATRDGEDPLAHQLCDLVHHSAGTTLVLDAAGERLGDAQAAVSGCQQHRAAVGAAPFLVEPDSDRPPLQLREQPTLCRGIVAQAGVSFVQGWPFIQAFLSTSGLPPHHLFVNFPG
jgi:hypothetical protein